MLTQGNLSAWLYDYLQSAVTVIDFDTVPSGTIVDAHYQSYGVTFKARSNSLAINHVYASALDPTPDTRPNVITLHKPTAAVGFDDTTGWIDVTFSELQQFVAIDTQAIPGVENMGMLGNNRPYMEVFGDPIQLPGGQQLWSTLATVPSPLGPLDPGFRDWQQIPFLSTAATANIRRVSLSCSRTAGQFVYACFDHLQYAHSFPSNFRLVRV
jgi:hypothetical protein